MCFMSLESFSMKPYSVISYYDGLGTGYEGYYEGNEEFNNNTQIFLGFIQLPGNRTTMIYPVNILNYISLYELLWKTKYILNCFLSNYAKKVDYVIVSRNNELFNSVITESFPFKK